MAIVLRSLSILLGLFFIFVGTMKLTSYLSKDLHKDLRKEYVKYSKVFPFSEALDFKVPSKWYRRVVGSLEIIFGAVMATIPSHAAKNVANVGLLLLTLLGVYSHYMVDDMLERTAPALVFMFMLTGRLVVYWQVQRREYMAANATTEKVSNENSSFMSQSNGFKQD